MLYCSLLLVRVGISEDLEGKWYGWAEMLASEVLPEGVSWRVGI